jgi:hypothetical protein
MFILQSYTIFWYKKQDCVCFVVYSNIRFFEKCREKAGHPVILCYFSQRRNLAAGNRNEGANPRRVG